MIATVAFVAACSWNAPGHNPYSGKPADAVARYTDIPAAPRARLVARVKQHQYDDFADITRDSIVGKHAYTDLRQMHFGNVKVCGKPDRSRWTDKMIERGMVYCEDGHCVIVPTVCNNVSRVTRLKAIELPKPIALVPEIQSLDLLPEDQSELLFDPPGAGNRNPFMGGYAVPRAEAPNWVEPAPAPWPQWQPVPWVLPPVIPAVPEPSTWMLALLGVGLAAWAARGKR